MVIVFLRALLFRQLECLRIFWRYYRKDYKWLLLDTYLHWQYLFCSPYRISRNFLKKRGETNIFAYGETPLTTLDTIATECRILSKDCVMELGCGSGRSCFWLRHFVGCQVVGVDYLPEFIRKAKRVARGIDQLDFIQADMTELPLSATVIYLYGTCLDDVTLEKLMLNLKRLPSGTKVITVSYPLTDYCKDTFSLCHEFQGKFPWGNTGVYLNIRTAAP